MAAFQLIVANCPSQVGGSLRLRRSKPMLPTPAARLACLPALRALRGREARLHPPAGPGQDKLRVYQQRGPGGRHPLPAAGRVVSAAVDRRCSSRLGAGVVQGAQ